MCQSSTHHFWEGWGVGLPERLRPFHMLLHRPHIKLLRASIRCQHTWIKQPALLLQHVMLAYVRQNGTPSMTA